MTRRPRAALLVCTLAMAAACTPARPGRSAEQPSAPSASPSSRPPHLTVPPPGPGESARTEFERRGASGPWTRTVVGRADATGSAVADGACIASTPGVHVTYRLLDARPTTDDEPSSRGELMSAEMACDGMPSRRPVAGARSPFTVSFDVLPEQVTQAYVVVHEP